MKLTLQRRHSEDCAGGHAARSRSYETDERRRTWKACYCPIYAGGTLAGKFKRRNTETESWVKARAIADLWEAHGAWDAVSGPVVSEVSPPVPDALTTCRIPPATLEHAAELYIANRKSRHIKAPTLQKYETLMRQLRAFADQKGYVMLEQFTVADMDEFYQSWSGGVRSKGKKLERLKGFFAFCVKRKMIADSPASDLEAPVGAGSAANKAPFTDSEIDRMLEASDRLGTTEWKNDRFTGSWSGEDVKTFILLECYTGLRISDAATFDLERLKGNECFLRMHKTGKPLFTWLPDEVVQQLRALGKKNGDRPFMQRGGSSRIETVADLWRRKLGKVWELCGKWEERPHPHRFRHTFVRILLHRGVSPRDVADLIGDTEQMVVKHYARWVPERQERLTRILREALGPQRPRLIPIAGGRK